MSEALFIEIYFPIFLQTVQLEQPTSISAIAHVHTFARTTQYRAE